MAYNQHQQVPFWDFIRSFDQRGAGVDHPEVPPAFGPGFFAGPPPPPPHGAHPHPPPPPNVFGLGNPWAHHRGGFGGPGMWGGPEGPGPRCGGRRGRHGRRHRDGSGEEHSRSRTVSPNPEGAENEKAEGEASGRECPSGGEGCRHGRGFGRRGGHAHRGRGGCGHSGRRGPPPFGGPGGMGGFDLSGLFNALNSHPMAQQPWAQMLRHYAEQAGINPNGGAQRSGEILVPEDADEENTFIPPIDVFSTETAYILHIALPGAKKEDVGVNWDQEKGVLNVAGVVYRQGDEEFLKTLSQSERKIGAFERSVKLPPGNEEKEEVDSDGIVAKLEDGILVVTVPKVEKEWTEVKRVDIQ